MGLRNGLVGLLSGTPGDGGWLLVFGQSSLQCGTCGDVTSSILFQPWLCAMPFRGTLSIIHSLGTLAKMCTERVFETQLLVLVDGRSIIGVQAIDDFNLLFLTKISLSLSKCHSWRRAAPPKRRKNNDGVWKAITAGHSIHAPCPWSWNGSPTVWSSRKCGENNCFSLTLACHLFDLS